MTGGNKMKRIVLSVAILIVLIVSMGCKSTATSTATTTTVSKTTTTTTTTAITTAPATTTTTAKPTTTPAVVDPVKIGILEDASGPYAAYGGARIAAQKVAIQMINDAGGIKSLGGAKLTLVMGATDGNAQTATSEAERLISNEKVVGIVGPTATSEILAAVPIYERYGVPAVTTIYDSSQFQKGYRYLFGVAGNPDAASAGWGDFIDWLAKNYGAPTDAIAFAYSTPGYNTFTDSIVTRLGQLGYKNVLLKEGFLNTVTDQSALVLKLKNAKASLVVYNGAMPDSVLFHKACDLYDYHPWLIGNPHIGSAPAIDALGAVLAKKVLTQYNTFLAGTGTYTDLYSTAPSLKAFRDTFYKANPSWTFDWPATALGAQEVFVLARAIENAGSRNPTDIAAALRKLDIQAPDSYLVVDADYPRLRMSDSGLVMGNPTSAAQRSVDMAGLQIIYPDNIAAVKPRINK